MEIKITNNDRLTGVVRTIFNRRTAPFFLALVFFCVMAVLAAEPLVIPFNFKSGAVISSSQMNANFEQVKAKINWLDGQLATALGDGAVWASSTFPDTDIYYLGDRVGIGTDDPTSLLHLYNTADVGINIESGNMNYDPYLIFGDSAVKLWANLADNSLKFDTGGSTRMTILEDGNVGIGTENPDVKLNIFGGSGLSLPDGTGSLVIGDVADGNMAFDTNEIQARFNATPADLYLQERGGNLYMVRSYVAGTPPAVIIGSPSATASLQVFGPIYQSSTLIHPDYVFDGDYKLENIEEHAAYMWENRHLKSVPPAQRMENGESRMNYGDTMMGMLEELEKAHIYIQQLNEKIQKLEDRLAETEQD